MLVELNSAQGEPIKLVLARSIAQADPRFSLTSAVGEHVFRISSLLPNLDLALSVISRALYESVPGSGRAEGR